jgi:4-hydroxy-4-methyl-2-oxoglutarate aldolase
VRASSGDNLAIHCALDRAQPGEIICAAAPGGSAFGIWGEITTRYALEQGVRALVTSCGVRDVTAMQGLGFPAFAAAHAIQGTVKRDAGDHEVPVRLGSALVRHGDWIVCDADGCVVVDGVRASEIAEAAALKSATERKAIAAINAGMSSRAALGLP